MIELGDVTLNVIDEGAGRPLLFIHGLGASALNWEHQLNAFNGGQRCIAPDVRGAGRSSRGSEPYRFELFADDLASLLGALGLERAIVVGQSLGGVLAQALALRHPEVVEGLVLVGTLCWSNPEELDGLNAAEALVRDGRLREVPELLMEHIHPAGFRAQHPDEVARLAREIVSCDVGDVLAKIAMVRTLDLREQLPALDVPALVVVGAHDGMCPPVNAERIAERLPGAQLVRLPDSGHQPHVDDPPTFNALLRSFIAMH